MCLLSFVPLRVKKTRLLPGAGLRAIEYAPHHLSRQVAPRPGVLAHRRATSTSKRTLVGRRRQRAGVPARQTPQWPSHSLPNPSDCPSAPSAASSCLTASASGIRRGAGRAPWRRPACPAGWRRSASPRRTATASDASSRPTASGTGRDKRRRPSAPAAGRTAPSNHAMQSFRDIPASISGYRFRIHRSREGFMRMASSVEMPSHSSTAVSVGTRCPFASPPATRAPCGARARSCSARCTAAGRCHRRVRHCP